jgi:hypothetical protein
VLAGEFKDVSVFVTTQVSGKRKWSDTLLHGNLRVMLLEHVGVPIASVRMNAVGGDLQRGIILEYELPLNFKFEPDLSSNFSAIRIHL